MPFGKRTLATTATPNNAATSAAAIATAEPSVELANVERYQALREILLRMLADAGRVAEAVKSNGSVPLRGIAEDIDPTTAPIEIKDLAEQFTFRQDGHVVHPFFGYAPPEKPDQIDPSAQFHIHQLILDIRELNVFCQEANRDEALGVALQSPRLPSLVDRILVETAFFAAYFDNLAVTHPFVTRAKATGHLYSEFDTLKLSFDRHMLMASDRMVEPGKLAELIPNAAWPLLGVELIRPSEATECLVHGIYFPAEYARQLANKASRFSLAARGPEHSAA